MQLNLNLGQKDQFGPCCPSPMDDKERVFYPSFHYDGKEEIELPRAGEMVIKFKKTGHSERTNSAGKTRYSCTIEVREIVSVKGGGESKSGAKVTMDALDAIKSKMMEDHEGEDGEGY